MTAKRYSVPSYLTEEERNKLREISAEWGCSMSSAIIRLIREKKLEEGLDGN